MVLGLLYHKSIYSAKVPNIINNQSEIKVIIERNQDSHYHLQGYVNDQIIDFLIDTGATNVCISENIAKKVNLQFGNMVSISTANGEANGYLTKIPKLIIGSIEFNNISAVIMPNIKDDEALLGMNILKKFDLTQHENELIMVYKKKD
jgi:aspartyl protease family protein